jgi:hypothetical protein
MNKPNNKIELKNLICIYNIAIRTGYGGATKRIIVFIDLISTQTFVWGTSSSKLADEFIVEHTYDIQANLHPGNQLSHVQILNHIIKKVNSNPIDACDILFNHTDTLLT